MDKTLNKSCYLGSTKHQMGISTHSILSSINTHLYMLCISTHLGINHKEIRIEHIILS